MTMPSTAPVQDIDLALLQQLLTLNETEVIVPLRVRREDVSRLKAVKLSDGEVVRIQHFQDYLFDRGFIPDNTFASLFVYLFNLAYTEHKKLADAEAQKEAQSV